MSLWSALERKAELRRRAGLRRELTSRSPEAGPIDLAGNDYLGLSRHPMVLSVAAQTLEAFGLGSSGSRLVRGTTDAHTALEQRLGELLGAPALVYSSGYLANLGAVRALCRKGTLLVRDAHAHASLIDGCALAGAAVEVAAHNDVDHVGSLLRNHSGPAVVIVESVYSVDGDAAPLRALHELCLAHDAILLVDEAHALGVLGPDGAGRVAEEGLSGADNLVVTATLSKALGSCGGVVAGPPALRRHLIDTGRGFIYDTAPPPAVVAGALAALELAVSDPALRAEVTRRSARAAGELGVAAPAAGVLSVPAPGPEAAVAWQKRCADADVAVGCFRPPSTPDEVSRLRLTMNANISPDNFTRAIAIVKETRP